ncbi:MAG: HK97 family phage prohead protease, partial [Bacillota bacterium]
MAEDGTFTGYASVFGNVDLVGDVVERGAFKQTIHHTKGRVPILWQHDARQPIGVTEEMREDDKGLWIRARLALATQKGREAYELLKMGAIRGLSIGYDVIKQKTEGGVRRLKELRLWEISVVTFPANPAAAVAAVKSVVPFQDLPLAERDRPWDADAAVARVRSWAGGPEKENMSWSKYRRAFLWYDASDPENFTSYKLPIADVIDGELRAVPRAIFAAAAVLQGARGGVNVPDDDKARLRAHLSRYYAKMRRAFDDDSIVPPWEDNGKSAGPDGLALSFLGWLELARQEAKAGRR